MPIINQTVKGGGVTPTGTIQITSNGTHDVTNYATADVQVPTTAPEIYRVFRNNNGKLENSISTPFLQLPNSITDIGNYCMYQAYQNTPSNVLYGAIDLSNLTSVTGNNACNGMFYGCTGIISVDLSSLTTVSGANSCANMFSGCTGITSVDMSGLTTISGSYACEYMFSGCNNMNIDLSSLTTLSGINCLNKMFTGCNNINVDLSGITVVSGSNDFFNEMFNGCKNSSVDLSNLVSINNTASGWNTIFSMAFAYTKNISVNLDKLVSITGSSETLNALFYGSAITEFKFKSLSILTCTKALRAVFASTHITDIYFYALTPSSFGSNTNQMEIMLNGVDGCTIHFPKNLDPNSGSTALTSLQYYPLFGGTNTVLVYDLPSTAHLIGANTTEYERSPKDDTATALAWRVKDTGTAPNLTIDWTPYYTSGTTDPAVSDTIYSDSACTVAVTTIDSIA